MKNLNFLLGIYIIFSVVGVFSFQITEKLSIMDGDLNKSLSLQSEGNLFKQISWITLLILTALYKVNNNVLIHSLKNNIVFFLRQNIGLILVLSFCLLSITWSNYPLLSFKRIIFQVILVLTLWFNVTSYLSRYELINMLSKAGIYILGLEVLVAIVYPYSAFEPHGAFAGIHSTKNNAGVVSSMFCGVFLAKYLLSINDTNKVKILLPFLGWLGLLLLSQSKTCIALTFILTALALINKKLLVLLAQSLFVSFALLLLSLFFLQVTMHHAPLNLVFQEFLENYSLTQRVDIWILLAQSLEDNLWFGHGYASFWAVGEVNTLLASKFGFFNFLNSGHNGYLDLTLTIGFSGLIIFLFWLGNQVFFKAKISNFLYLYFLCFSLAYNMIESSYIRDLHPLWVFFLIALFSSNLPKLKHYQ